MRFSSLHGAKIRHTNSLSFFGVSVELGNEWGMVGGLGLGDCRFWEDRMSANGVRRLPVFSPGQDRSLPT